MIKEHKDIIVAGAQDMLRTFVRIGDATTKVTGDGRLTTVIMFTLLNSTIHTIGNNCFIGPVKFADDGREMNFIDAMIEALQKSKTTGLEQVEVEVEV